MSTEQQPVNFSKLLDTDYYSGKTKQEKRYVAVAAALQILNTAASSTAVNADSLNWVNVVDRFEELLPKMSKTILDTLEVNDQ